MGVIRSIHDLKQSQNVPATMSHIEYDVHEGNVYHSHIESPDLGDNDTFEMFFRTPDNSVRCHSVVTISAELAGEFSLRESATVSLSGSVLTAFNVDRNSSNIATGESRSSPTITASGTLLENFEIGGGRQGQTGGDGSVDWILKQGTIYIFRFLSSATSNDCSINHRWTEEES